MQKQYKVRRDYRAFYGEADVVLVKGAVVELDEEQAAWVNRDSPGTLVEQEPERKRQKTTAKNRQQTARQDRGRQEPITRATFGAVKD